MSSRRAKRGRGGGPGPEVTKEEYAVAKFLRSKVPTKTTTLCGMRVEYFVGSKAIDALLASQVGSDLSPVFVSFKSKVYNRKS